MCFARKCKQLAGKTTLERAESLPPNTIRASGNEIVKDN